MKLKIDHDLVPIKAHYFLFNAGTAPVVPFMPTLAKQLGFSAVIVGIMYTILPIVGMLAKPIFGYIADRYQRHRMLFLLSEIITAISFFLIMFIPPMPQPELTFECHNGVSVLKYCSPAAASIRTKLESHLGDASNPCKLQCHAEKNLWDIVCKDWLKDSSLECKKQSQSGASPLDFTVYVNMSNSLTLAQCMYIRLAHDQANIFNRNVTMVCPSQEKYFKTPCEMDCHDAYVAEVMENISNGEAVKLYQFWMFFLLLIMSWIGMSVVVSIGDAICFAILGERHHLYGNQRLYGSIGFGIFSIIAGVLVDTMSGDSSTKDYSIVFWMTFVIIAFDVFASTKLKHTQTHLSPNILKDVGQMFLSVRCVSFFAWCITIGLCTALVWNFLFWYLEDLGSTESMKTLQGFATGIQCFGGELPFFFLSGWILKKIGHVNAMSLVLLGFAVRFFLYSILKNPWYVLPIELTSGVTFGIFYVTMASYASIVAPPGTEATMQGLVGAIFEGIGVSLGSFICGLLIDSMGGASTFRIFGLFALIAFVVHVLFHKYLARHPNNHNMNGALSNSDIGDLDNTSSSRSRSEENLNNVLHDGNQIKLTEFVVK